jgi:L-amino acid N-acyltransferase YncA
MQQIRAAFRSNKPRVEPVTHYVVWSKTDGSGIGYIYASQHMPRSQAQKVATIKQNEGCHAIRVMRVV